jgi:hypothetical protein
LPPAIRKPKSVDQVARVRHQHQVAGRRDGLRHVGEAFLGAERGDDLRFGIELHAKAAAIIGGLRLAQAGNAARGRIAVGARLADRFLELVDDVLGRRQVRVAHAEIDDVGALDARAGLRPIDDFENIGRQALDAMELVHGPIPGIRGLCQRNVKPYGGSAGLVALLDPRRTALSRWSGALNCASSSGAFTAPAAISRSRDGGTRQQSSAGPGLRHPDGRNGCCFPGTAGQQSASAAAVQRSGVGITGYLRNNPSS